MLPGVRPLRTRATPPPLYPSLIGTFVEGKAYYIFEVRVVHAEGRVGGGGIASRDGAWRCAGWWARGGWGEGGLGGD